MSRQSDNFKILEILSDFFNDHPDQRFCQGLMNMDILRRIQIYMKGENFSHYLIDEASTESQETLKRVTKRIEALQTEVEEDIQ